MTPTEALALLHLEEGANLAQIATAWKAAAFASHPDRGGSHQAMCDVNLARLVLDSLAPSVPAADAEPPGTPSAPTVKYFLLWDGTWGVKVEGFVPLVHQILWVVGKSGVPRQVTIKRIVWKSGNVCLCALKHPPPPPIPGF